MLREQCYVCGGHGLVSDYGNDGEDFYGAKECSCCDGTGFLFITPHGRLVVYPGGPFRGRVSGAPVAGTGVASHLSHRPSKVIEK